MSSSEIIAIVVSIICPLASILIAYFGLKRLIKKDTQEEGQEKGVVLTELGYIKSGTDDIKKRLDKIDDRQDEQSRAFAALEAKVDAHLRDKNAHNYKGE